MLPAPSCGFNENTLHANKGCEQAYLAVDVLFLVDERLQLFDIAASRGVIHGVAMIGESVAFVQVAHLLPRRGLNSKR